MAACGCFLGLWLLMVAHAVCFCHGYVLQVYKGLWKGSIVAVKTIVLPAAMSGQEKREKMAIMEAAISSALSHPNIMQVRSSAMPEQFLGSGSVQPQQTVTLTNRCNTAIVLREGSVQGFCLSGRSSSCCTISQQLPCVAPSLGVAYWQGFVIFCHAISMQTLYMCVSLA